MRDRLIGLIDQAYKKCKYRTSCRACSGYGKGGRCLDYHIADYLLANGVIVPPCKVGDKTYLLLEKVDGGYNIVESQCVCISENKYCKVYSMSFDCPEIDNKLEYCLGDFGKWVFLTREEAEAKLKGEQ